MKKIFLGVAAVCAGALMMTTAGCSSSKNVAKIDLAGEWIISTVNGTELEKQENVPFLAFNIEEKRVHGNASCNVVNGGFMQEEGKENSLKFSQMISTMMACPNMDTERLVLEALNKVASFTLDQDKSKLSLLDENGTEVMSLTKNAGETLSK